jgi:hypothetical protein
MTKAIELIRYAKPAPSGCLSPADWAQIEDRLGGLPIDFKDLVSTFGFGRFGDLYLFHPLFPLNSGLRLPEACSSTKAFLKDQRSEIIDLALSKYSLPLGHLASRRYLLSGESGWALVEFDTEEYLEVGDSIIAFLESAYKGLTEDNQWSPLAEAIWKSSPTGIRDRFFEGHREM